MLPDPAEPSAFDASPAGNVLAGAPRLSQAVGALLREIEILDEAGERRRIAIPAERPLTVFVDKRELVTLMTLGACPELLVLGYLLNQRLVGAVTEIESVSVDWDVAAAAVRTRAGVEDLERKTARRVVTTGCGQGTVFGDAMAQLDAVRLPGVQAARIRQDTLVAMLEVMRQRNSVHRKAGSVHGCALFRGARMLMFVEDVGRHNAIDCIAGWMAMHGVSRRRQDLLHHRAADERDGHEGGADGRADHRLAQRRHRDGARTGGQARHDAVRPRREPPFPLLHRLRALRRRARTASRAGAARRRLGPVNATGGLA